MSNRRRLHPVAILTSFFKSLKDLIIPLIIFLFIGNKISFDMVLLLKFAGIAALLLSVLIKSVLSWYRFTYYLEDGELRIEFGIFVRNRRYIPRERVQTVDVKAGPVQRLFGLVSLQIETAGGGVEAEAVLNAISKQEANNIRQYLSQKEGMTGFLPEAEAMVSVYSITPKELLALASTSGGIGVILSAVVAFLSQVDDIIPYEKLYHRFEYTLHFSVMFFIVAGLIGISLAWALSIIGTLLKYGNFKLERKKDELLISAGLLEKRQITLPLSKIQAVRLKQNPLRRIFGLTAIYAESAGSYHEKEKENAAILFPIVKVNRVNSVLQRFVPEYEVPRSFLPLPKQSLGRYIRKILLPFIPIIVILIFVIKPWGLFSVIIIPIVCFIGYVQYKGVGWATSDTSLFIKKRLLNHSIVLLQKKKIQAFETSQSFFQKKQGLRTIEVSIKSKILGKRFMVADLTEQEGMELLKWFSYSKGSD